jgi:hypothetical protein
VAPKQPTKPPADAPPAAAKPDGCEDRSLGTVIKLLHGIFRCDNDRVLKSFVYVPEGYEAVAGSNRVYDCLDALKLPRPQARAPTERKPVAQRLLALTVLVRCAVNQLSFFCDEAYAAAPHTATSSVYDSVPHPKYDEKVELVNSRFESALGAINEACMQTESMHLLCKPDHGNMLAELMCKTAKRGTTTLVSPLRRARARTLPRALGAASLRHPALRSTCLQG